MIEKLEDTLNGGFGGLYGEVVTFDCYKVKELSFVPDVVIDLGANVGCFTRFARELFPNALIVAVEPNEDNFAQLIRFTEEDNIIFINKAIGIDKVYHGTTSANGSGETYLSAGLGYPADSMEAELTGGGIEKSSIPLIMVDEIINKYVCFGQKVILKIDIEGNEHTILSHKKSMELMKGIDYICMEVHFYALYGGDIYEDMLEQTMRALKSFDESHDIKLDNIHFYATKKPQNGN
jgi:FkbM family methyltransferase